MSQRDMGLKRAVRVGLFEALNTRFMHNRQLTRRELERKVGQISRFRSFGRFTGHPEVTQNGFCPDGDHPAGTQIATSNAPE